MSVRGRKVVRTAGAGRSASCGVSPKALYARPMALRQLYSDAGSVIRRGHREAAEAHRQNSR